MIPATTRLSISNKLSSTASWVKWSGNTAGNLAWVLTTTALMIGLPYALAVEGEAALQAQEKEIYSKEQGQQAVSTYFNPGVRGWGAGGRRAELLSSRKEWEGRRSGGGTSRAAVASGRPGGNGKRRSAGVCYLAPC